MTRELIRLLDGQTRELLGMTAEDFIAAVEAGEEFENPAAFRLEVLAEALIPPKPLNPRDDPGHP